MIGRRQTLLGLAAMSLTPHVRAAEASLIRMGSSGNYPPFTFLDETGRMTGILVDVLTLIGGHTGLRFEFGDLPWARAQKMVETGQIDGLCTVATAERRVYADFAPTALYEEPSVLIYRTGNSRAEAVRSVEDLTGLQIGAPLGTGSTKDVLPRQTIIWVADTDNLLAMIEAGHIDATLLGDWTTRAKLKAYRDRDTLRTKTLKLPVDDAVRFGLRKSFPGGAAILARVDAAIQAAKASGAIAGIISRYVS